MDITIILLVIGILAVIGIATFAHGIAAERAARNNWVAIQAAELEILRLREMIRERDGEAERWSNFYLQLIEKYCDETVVLKEFMQTHCLVQRPKSKWFAKIEWVTPAGVKLRNDIRAPKDNWVPFKE